MAKTYDFAAALKYIQTNSDYLDSVSLGMQEDWFWTAETVYEDERLTRELDKEGLKIGGIDSSHWATPTMHIIFKDGREEFKPCFVGESEGQKPEWFSLGVLSSPFQEMIDDKITPKLEDKSDG
jgi:hypothetical protein